MEDLYASDCMHIFVYKIVRLKFCLDYQQMLLKLIKKIWPLSLQETKWWVIKRTLLLISVGNLFTWKQVMDNDFYNEAAHLRCAGQVFFSFLVTPHSFSFNGFTINSFRTLRFLSYPHTHIVQFFWGIFPAVLGVIVLSPL